MSKDWEVEGKNTGIFGTIANVLTLGLYDSLSDTYTVRNKETGERKEVTAWNEKHLGEKIAKGEFDK